MEAIFGARMTMRQEQVRATITCGDALYWPLQHPKAKMIL